MPDFIYVIYAVLAGIVQGITEWLPISSTAHLMLLHSLFGDSLDGNVLTTEFMAMFDVVIQFGSILAIIVLFFRRLNPFALSKTKAEKNKTWSLWAKILIASVPAGIIGVIIDDRLDELKETKPLIFYIIASALVVYGVMFIVIERKNRHKIYRINEPEGIDVKTAIGIGAFQVLALIPGTSRSGSTIIGSTVLGVSRKAAAEFSFFLAIPVMVAASAWKTYGFFKGGDGAVSAMNSQQIIVLAIGTVVSFLVSLAAVKFLVGFVRRHSFEGFGWYRIALAVLVVLYFTLVR